MRAEIQFELMKKETRSITRALHLYKKRSSSRCIYKDLIDLDKYLCVYRQFQVIKFEFLTYATDDVGLKPQITYVWLKPQIMLY